MIQQDAADDGTARVCRLVGSIEVPVPWDLPSLIDAVARGRGKPIHVAGFSGLSGPGRPCGIWIARDADDIIVYDDTTSDYHAEQIVLHELGHLLLDHHEMAGGVAIDTMTIAQLVPDIEPETVRKILGRAVFDNEQESQAELFASLMMSQRRRRDRESRILDTFLDG
jgi:hypothetical protein